MPMQEKLFVLILSLTIFFLVFYSQIASKHTLSYGQKNFLFPKKIIAVQIEGAVKKPGIYRVQMGTYLQSVLQKAKPDRYADVKKIVLTKPLEKNQKIFIPYLQYLEIHIDGAVRNPGVLRVPCKTRVCQLKKHLAFCDNGDYSCLSSRRYLRDQERFFFPEKKK